jgi:hypothetical protein
MKSLAPAFAPVSVAIHLRSKLRPPQSATAEISQVNGRQSLVTVKYGNSHAMGDAVFLRTSSLRWRRILGAVGAVFSRSDLRGWSIPSPDQLQVIELEVFEHDSELDPTMYSVTIDFASKHAELSVGVPEHSKTRLDLPEYLFQDDAPSLVKAVLLELEKSYR